MSKQFCNKYRKISENEEIARLEYIKRNICDFKKGFQWRIIYASTKQYKEANVFILV